MRPEELELHSRLNPLKPLPSGSRSRIGGSGKVEQDSAFSKVLAGELASKGEAAGTPKKATSVEFSAHALARLEERNIMLSPHNRQRLDQAVQLADRKGSVNTLVLMDDTAYLVSVKNMKVITAITKDAAVENVFTQIDSATII